MGKNRSFASSMERFGDSLFWHTPDDRCEFESGRTCRLALPAAQIPAGLCRGMRTGQAFPRLCARRNPRKRISNPSGNGSGNATPADAPLGRRFASPFENSRRSWIFANLRAADFSPIFWRCGNRQTGDGVKCAIFLAFRQFSQKILLSRAPAHPGRENPL